MAFREMESARIECAMAEFMAKRRPPPELRDRVDLHYRIEDQSVVIFLMRPFHRDPRRKIEEPVAKATYVRRSNRWRIFWQRADLKWHSYPSQPEALLFEEFLAVVDQDEDGCFWG